VSIAHFTLCLPSNERRAAGFCGLGTAAQLLLARFLPWRGGRKKRKRTTDPAPCAEPKHGAAYGNRSGGTARPSIPVRWLVVWPHNDGPPAAESVPVFLSSSWLWAAPCLLGPWSCSCFLPPGTVFCSRIRHIAYRRWHVVSDPAVGRESALQCRSSVPFSKLQKMERKEKRFPSEYRCAAAVPPTELLSS
jgi:hypothetical protein